MSGENKDDGTSDVQLPVRIVITRTARDEFNVISTYGDEDPAVQKAKEGELDIEVQERLTFDEMLALVVRQTLGTRPARVRPWARYRLPQIAIEALVATGKT